MSWSWSDNPNCMTFEEKEEGEGIKSAENISSPPPRRLEFQPFANSVQFQPRGGGGRGKNRHFNPWGTKRHGIPLSQLRVSHQSPARPGRAVSHLTCHTATSQDVDCLCYLSDLKKYLLAFQTEDLILNIQLKNCLQTRLSKFKLPAPT
jgi:hypothetical protein